MNIFEDYKAMLKEFTVDPTITMKQLIKNLDKVSKNRLDVNQVNRVSGNQVDFNKFLTRFKNEFPKLEGDDRYNYLRRLLERQNALNFAIPVKKDTDSDSMFTYILNTTDNQLLLNLAKELSRFIKEHNQKVDENK